MSDNLPPLPEPRGLFDSGGGWMSPTKLFKPEQMQAYARAAIEADRVSRDVPATPDDLCDDDLSELAHSANQEALSFGLSHDVFLRYFKTIRNRALAASPQPQPVQSSQFGSHELQSLILEKLAQPVQAQPSEQSEKVAHCHARDAQEPTLKDAQVEQAAQPVAWARIPRFTGSAQTPMIVLTDPKSTAWLPLYTAPPKAVPLTDEQKDAMWFCARRSLGGGMPEDYYIQGINDAEYEHGITPATVEKEGE